MEKKVDNDGIVLSEGHKEMKAELLSELEPFFDSIMDMDTNTVSFSICICMHVSEFGCNVLSLRAELPETDCGRWLRNIMLSVFRNWFSFPVNMPLINVLAPCPIKTSVSLALES